MSKQKDICDKEEFTRLPHQNYKTLPSAISSFLIVCMPGSFPANTSH